MATPLLQKARQRKMIYFGAIIALFTVSLLHFKFIIKPQATLLQLRETERGEVKLTSSAVRLLLTGSRGLAVTYLWYTAMDKQKRGEYNELELIVTSITELQPYFITPWLFQSWNISFNVAVECDRPRDKYYYISRGLELLAEGERRNGGTGEAGSGGIIVPGNPELRHFMGFTYQLKLGTSDENRTMRSLLEMSCIDPVERNPSLFWMTNEKNQKSVNLVELAKFTEKNPRLIRRLKEQLGYADPQRIVQFLEDHQSIPNRFKPVEKSKLQGVRVSELKDPLDQFPILPPKQGNWPDPKSYDLTTESMDVFLVCRTWYSYAQKPLPPEDNNPRATTPVYDKLRYRIPKGMVTQLFRQYPARAQVYIAETLQAEGWFDRYGWDDSRWFEKKTGQIAATGQYTFGTESKYHAPLAWKRGHKMYKEYGTKNGIYIAPADMAALNAKAEFFRTANNVQPGQMVQNIRGEWRTGPMAASLDAHQKLAYSEFYRRMSNFDAFLYQSEGEADPITAASRKAMFYAERKQKHEPSESMLELYRQAWDLYVHACFKYPRFAQVSSMQEETYEAYLRSLRETQKLNSELFRKTALKTARLFVPSIMSDNFYRSTPVLLDGKVYFLPLDIASREIMVTQLESDPQEVLNVAKRPRKQYGALDLIQFYDGPDAAALKDGLFRFSEGLMLANNTCLAGAVTYPGQKYYLLTRTTNFLEEDAAPKNWQPLFTKETRRISTLRLGWDR